MTHVDEGRRVKDTAARLNRSLLTLSRCNRVLWQARGEQELLQSICQILVETAGVRLSWIGYCEDDAEKTVRPVASAGNGLDYLERVKISWANSDAGQGPVGDAIRTGKFCWVDDIRTDSRFSHGRTEAVARGYVSCVAFPLVADGGPGPLDLRGTLTLYADAFDKSDIERYADLASYLTCAVARFRSNLAHDVSYGVAALRTREDRRRAEEALRERAQLLDLTHDSIFVRDMNDVITYWNRGAEELYGWKREEAAGKVTHELLHTIFPEPLEQITATVLRTGRWDGELTHTKRDGTQVIVASRWSLQEDERGRPVGTLETNNDISERKRADAELRESEERYRYIFESTGVSIWEEDFSQVKVAIDDLKSRGVHNFHEYFAAHPEFVQQAITMVKVVDVNDVTLKLFAAESKDELLGSLHKVLVPETREIFVGELIAIAEGRTSFEGETVLRTLKGESVAALFTITFPPPPARLDNVLVTVTDITERKRAEESLQRQANLLEQTHDAILVWGLPGGIIYWNRGAEQLYGFSREDAIGRLSHDLLRTEHPMPRELFEATIERHGTWSGELTHRAQDGRKVVVDSRHVLLGEPDGRRLVLETNRDITERKRAEYLTGQVFESSPDGVCIIGRDCRYQRVNPVYERFWGMPAERIIGMHVADLVGRDVFEQRAKPNLDRCLAGEEVSFAEWFATARGRQYRAISYSPLRPDSERVEAVLVIARDLTDHMQASEALREAQTELARITRLTTMGQLAASIAHEVNQPLTGVVTNGHTCLHWLEDETLDLGKARMAAQRIVRDGQRASDIIGRIRALMTKSAPQAVEVDLNGVITEVLALAQTELRMRRVSVETELAAALPPGLGDRVQLQQVILNLVVNGIDAMVPVTDRPRMLLVGSRLETGGDVMIFVRDHGTGLNPETADKIFNAFFTTKAKGIGMGLAICRSIVEAHGGRLWASPASPHGAMFQFTVPIKAGRDS